MKKYLTWLDDNILALLAGFLLVFIPLYPKWPLFDAIPGYLVRVRLEDLFVLLTAGIFVLQFLRKKVQFSFNLVTFGIAAYIIIGALSSVSAIFVTGTVPLVDIHVAKTALHFFRRVEYFSLFFILFGSIKSLRQVKILVILLFITLAVVTLYGYGQKYLYFPAWSTMNREFAKGWTLYLTEHARVLSTFGGHYDLAGYLVIALSLCWSFFFGLKNKLAKFAVGILLAGGFWLMILTASRISFFAYLVGLAVVVFFWTFKKSLKWGVSRLAIATFLSLLIMLSFGDLSDRFLRLIHADERVASIRQLVLSPFGVKPTDRALFLENNISAVTSQSDTPPTLLVPPDVTGLEPVLMVATYSATGERTLVERPRTYSACALRFDLSTCIRLESTWPRALEGLKSNYLLGSGYATLTKSSVAQFTEAESTDSDIFRALGETGILGFLTFFGTLVIMAIVAIRSLGGIKDPFIYSLIVGFLGFLAGLLVNSAYIDIFEASKVAYVFWGVSGLALGTIYFMRAKIKEDREPLRLDVSFKGLIGFLQKILKSDKFWIIVLAVFAFVLRTYKIDAPLADWHSWRQADTSAVTRNFLRHDTFNLFYPQFDDLSSVASGLPNPNGFRYVEFPIYNLTTVALKRVFPELTVEAAGRATTAAFSSISVVFLFLLSRRLFNRRIGFLSALVFATLPYSVFYGRTILPDPTMVAFSLGSIYFALRYTYKSKLTNLLISFVFAALALLVKPYAVFLLAPIAYILYTEFKFSKKFFIISVCYLLAAIPFVLWRFWMSQFPEGIPASDWLFNGDGIRFKGAFWYWLFADRIGRLILGYWGLILLSFGLVAKQIGKYKHFPLVYLLSAVCYLLVFATGNVRHDYYQILLLPSLSILVGIGLDALLSGNLISKSLAVISFAFMLAFSWYFVKDYYNINHREIVEAGQKVRDITNWQAQVIAPYGGDTAFLYQSDRKGWPLVEGTIDAMIQKHAHYYVSVTEDDLTKELLADSWPVWVPKPEKVVKKYKLLIRTPKYLIIQLVPDNQLPR